MRKNKYPQTIHTLGKFSKLMTGGVLAAKYSDPDNPMVNEDIKNNVILNTLIHFCFLINVMKHETVEVLGLYVLIQTPTMLQLTCRSTLKLEGILEDAIVLMDLWEYATYFMNF